MPGSSIAGRTDCQPVSDCLAIHTDHELVFASDSRTHGGVDQVNTYSKMHRFEVTGERLFVLLCAGNLSTSQTVVHRIDRQFERPEGHGLLRSETVFEAAEYVGELSRTVRNHHGAHNADANFEADSRFFQDLQASWSATVAQGMRDLPRFPWEGPDLFDSP